MTIVTDDERVAFEVGKKAWDTEARMCVPYGSGPVIHVHEKSILDARAIGYVSQCAKAGVGIPTNVFIWALKTIFEDDGAAASRWISFSIGCVAYDQYVDFSAEGNSHIEMNRWLETTLAGMLKVKMDQGMEAAKRVVLLSEDICLYPWETRDAADILMAGKDPEAIREAIDNDRIEEEKPLFRHMSGVASVYETRLPEVRYTPEQPSM